MRYLQYITKSLLAPFCFIPPYAGRGLGVFLVLFTSLNSCKEVGPYISLNTNPNLVSDTAYLETAIPAAQQKNVVIEEFTGVRCPNCPQGHIIIANIKAANPGRVVSASLHPINSLGRAYSFSPQDLQNTNAQTLFDYLIPVGFEPVAAINRKMFAGSNAVLVDKVNWENYAEQEISGTTPVNILLDKSYDNTSRELTVTAEAHYTQTVTEKNKLTILLTESNIITPQLNGSVVDTFYNHKDVTRAFVSVVQGDLLSAGLEKGRVFRNVYKVKLNNTWLPENMHIIAYVHEFQNSKIVYQGQEVEVQ